MSLIKRKKGVGVGFCNLRFLLPVRNVFPYPFCFNSLRLIRNKGNKRIFTIK